MTVEQEKQQAFEKYGPFNSTHEVYGVLKEEVDEFWDLVKDNNPVYCMSLQEKHEEMIKELTQIAAIALRAIDELKNDKIKFV